MNALWFLALFVTVVLACALNSMLVLGVMVGPLFIAHIWITLRETRP